MKYRIIYSVCIAILIVLVIFHAHAMVIKLIKEQRNPHCLTLKRDTPKIINVRISSITPTKSEPSKSRSAMTSCGYELENNQKMQGQFVGYVKVKFFAHPFTNFLNKIDIL